MGHPAPFNLEFIGIGNEQWGEEYPERLEPFIKAIRKVHPEIKICRKFPSRIPKEKTLITYGLK